jgi:hypothetical protein
MRKPFDLRVVIFKLKIRLSAFGVSSSWGLRQAEKEANREELFGAHSKKSMTATSMSSTSCQTLFKTRFCTLDFDV